MCAWEEMNWFAVQTKPHQENLAATQISRLKVETFLPKVKRAKSICGVSRVISQPLFPGYLFARFVPSLSLDLVRFGYGVLRIVGTSQSPLPVAAVIIDCLHQHVGTDGCVELKTPQLKPGDTVEIEQGPLQGFMGKVEHAHDDGRRVTILLEAIHAARLVIEKHLLTAAVPG